MCSNSASYLLTFLSTKTSRFIASVTRTLDLKYCTFVYIMLIFCIQKVFCIQFILNRTVQYHNDICGYCDAGKMSLLYYDA